MGDSQGTPNYRDIWYSSISKRDDRCDIVDYYAVVAQKFDEIRANPEQEYVVVVMVRNWTKAYGVCAWPIEFYEAEDFPYDVATMREHHDDSIVDHVMLEYDRDYSMVLKPIGAATPPNVIFYPECVMLYKLPRAVLDDLQVWFKFMDSQVIAFVARVSVGKHGISIHPPRKMLQEQYKNVQSITRLPLADRKVAGEGFSIALTDGFIVINYIEAWEEPITFCDRR